MLFVGFKKLSKSIGDRCQCRVRSYGIRKQLHRRMLSLHPIYPDFVSGAECGDPTYFFCRVSQPDAWVKAHGVGEFKRHFSSDGHWNRDICYRVYAGLPVYNKLLEPIELSAIKLLSSKPDLLSSWQKGSHFPRTCCPNKLEWCQKSHL